MSPLVTAAQTRAAQRSRIAVRLVRCAELRIAGHGKNLADDAKRLYPDSDYLQREWQRAVTLVRDTEGGWLLERPLRKQECPHA